MYVVSTLEEIVCNLMPMFTAPSGQLLLRLVVGWVLCPGRRTITGILPYADPDGHRSHDAYHRFFRGAAWCRSALFQAWAGFLMRKARARDRVWLIVDDTVHKKSGRKVDGAKLCRDAVRSARQPKKAYVWGLPVVVLCVRVEPAWHGEPLALPINMRLYRKGVASYLDLAEQMVQEVAAWFPAKTFSLVADGAYASLAARALPRTCLVSRLRFDAALYAVWRKPSGPRVGRPRKKGARLPSPQEMAAHVRRWQPMSTRHRCRHVNRLVYCRVVVWYRVQPNAPVLLVISRDPTGRQRDDFFFTTDLQMAPRNVLEEFANRWAIEDTFRNVKQFLGAEQPQSWKADGPERVAAFAYVLYGVVWSWYMAHGRRTLLRSTPWYPQKRTPSFRDAMACLRKALWKKRFSATAKPDRRLDKFQRLLVDALAAAA